MNSAVEQDMDWSSVAFRELVWPLCQTALGGGELMQMEGRPDTELARLLDMRAGIDGWQFCGDGMRGIASRVQTGTDWRTFTVRMRRNTGAVTEYEKRKCAMESGRGLLYPPITVQAYLADKSGPVLSVGITRTESLIRFIGAGLHTMRQTDNASFAVCKWSDMRERGFKVAIIVPT